MVKEAVESGETLECSAVDSETGRLSLEEEWALLCASIVCGHLKGALPPGFLSKFRSLPNEVLLRIWEYIDPLEKRSYRQVCKHWKALWESLKVPRMTISNIRIFMRNGKLVVKICRSYFSHRANVIEICPTKECLKQTLSLIELHGAIYGSSSRAIVIGDGAARKEFFDAILEQRWSVHSVTFFGDLTNSNPDEVTSFIRSLQDSGSDIQFLCFSDADVRNDLITDEFAKCVPHSVKELIVGVSPNSIERLGEIALTDSSLPHLLKHERIVVLPPCKFTHNGIEASLKEYFRVCYERSASSVGGCIFFPAQFNFLLSGSMDASELARIHMNGVEAAFSRPVWLVYKSEHMFNEGADEPTSTGRVIFSTSATELEAVVDLSVTSLKTYKELIEKYRPEDYRSRTPRTSMNVVDPPSEFCEDDYDDEGRYVAHFWN